MHRSILYLLASIAVCDGLEKCCGTDEYLIADNTTFGCEKYPGKRYAIIADSSNFVLNPNSTGECVDFTIGGYFHNYRFLDGTLTDQTPTGEDYFPKCCPIGYHYDPTKHSCDPSLDPTMDFIESPFIKVGLPWCKLVLDKHRTLDLSGDKTQFCVDKNLDGTFIRRECDENLQVCDGIRCVKKCCPDGQSFVNGSNCRDTFVNGLDLRFSSNIAAPSVPFAVISNRTCKSIYLLRDNGLFTLQEDGVLKYWQNFTNSYIYEPPAHPESYCIEHSNKSNAMGFFFFMCRKEIIVKDKFLYTLWPKILSCVFLALTILIYLVLGETRNIFGKILLNYCLSILALFSLLIYAQTNLKVSDGACKATGYMLIFLSTVSFAWLNVMCCDIWFTFGCTKQSVGAHQRRRDLKRFLLYSLYGYGMPSVLTLVILLFTDSKVLPESIQPYVGTSSCFIETRKDNYAPILFLRLPHLIIQIVNVALFVKTITYCLKIKNEINRINDTTRNERRTRFNKDKERLFLILKLSIIMGVTYILDVLSAFVDMSQMGDVAKYVEIVWDCINCLQGVFIFIIFICKKKIFHNILRKLKLSSTNMSTNQSTITSSTRMSMLNSMAKKGRT